MCGIMDLKINSQLVNINNITLHTYAQFFIHSFLELTSFGMSVFYYYYGHSHVYDWNLYAYNVHYTHI